MTEFESSEKLRAAQEARASVARSGRRGTPPLEAALRRYLSVERYREQPHDAPTVTGTRRRDKPRQ